MSALLVQPARAHAYAKALSTSRQTAQHLQTYGAINSRISVPFLTRAESSDVWNSYERLLVSCLQTGDDESAHKCLEKLIARFGATNERVMGLRGLYQEAVAEGPAALEKILTNYDEALAADPVNIVSSSTPCHISSTRFLLIDIPSHSRNVALLYYAASRERVRRSLLLSHYWRHLRRMLRLGRSFPTCIYHRACICRRYTALKRSC